MLGALNNGGRSNTILLTFFLHLFQLISGLFIKQNLVYPKNHHCYADYGVFPYRLS